MNAWKLFSVGTLVASSVAACSSAGATDTDTSASNLTGVSDSSKERIEREQCVVSNTVTDPNSPFAAFPDGLTLNHDVYWKADGSYLIYGNTSPSLDPNASTGDSAPSFIEWSQGPSKCNGPRCTNASNFVFLNKLDAAPQVFPQNWVSRNFTNEAGKVQTVFVFDFAPGFTVSCESHRITSERKCNDAVQKLNELASKVKVPDDLRPTANVCGGDSKSGYSDHQ